MHTFCCCSLLFQPLQLRHEMMLLLKSSASRPRYPFLSFNSRFVSQQPKRELVFVLDWVAFFSLFVHSFVRYFFYASSFFVLRTSTNDFFVHSNGRKIGVCNFFHSKMCACVAVVVVIIIDVVRFSFYANFSVYFQQWTHKHFFVGPIFPKFVVFHLIFGSLGVVERAVCGDNGRWWFFFVPFFLFVRSLAFLYWYCRRNENTRKNVQRIE